MVVLDHLPVNGPVIVNSFVVVCFLFFCLLFVFYSVKGLLVWIIISLLWKRSG